MSKLMSFREFLCLDLVADIKKPQLESISHMNIFCTQLSCLSSSLPQHDTTHVPYLGQAKAIDILSELKDCDLIQPLFLINHPASGIVL